MSNLFTPNASNLVINNSKAVYYADEPQKPGDICKFTLPSFGAPKTAYAAVTYVNTKAEILAHNPESKQKSEYKISLMPITESDFMTRLARNAEPQVSVEVEPEVGF